MGKSTLAKRLHGSLPLSFLINIDLIRRHISGHQEFKEKEPLMVDTSNMSEEEVFQKMKKLI